MDLLDGDVELTEFEEIEVHSIKGVKDGANGFPVLMMKGLGLAGPEPVAKGDRNCPKCDAEFDADHKGSNCPDCGAKLPPADAAKSLPDWHGEAVALAEKAIAADGSVDEQPDIDGGKQAIALIGKLIGYEAQELAAGQSGESSDIQTLCAAVDALRWWVGGEQAVSAGNIEPVMQSAAKAAESTKTQNDLPDSAFAYIEPGGDKDSDGKTTPRSLRHFPVHDKPHAENALARLSSSPFGDKAKAKVHAAAKKFGIDTDTSKSAGVAEGATAVNTEAQGNEGLSKALEAAVTKAMAPLQERIASLDAELAKVKATPIPGGPALSRNVQVKNQRGEPNEDWAAKAALYRAKADAATSPADREGYRQLAREADEESKAAIA
jgi:hypothetical protein